MSISGPLKIINEGLTLALDAGNAKSYPATGSTWFDLISGSNNGALTNGAYYTSSYPAYINFDGINDYINFSSSVYPVSGLGFTIEVVGSVDSGSSAPQRFLSKGHYGWTPGYFLGKYPSTDGKIRFVGGIGSATSVSSSAVYCYTSQSYNVGQVCHLSLVSTGTYMYLYVDGVKSNLIKATGTVGTLENGTDLNYSASISGLSIATSAKFSVGNYANSNASILDEYLKGRISLVKVYNTALTENQVLLNYNSVKSKYWLSYGWTITPAYSGSNYWDTALMGPLVFDTSGSWIINPVNSSVKSVKMWGGGGSCNKYVTGGTISLATTIYGGGGGFASGSVIFDGGASYTVVVGMNGNQNIYSGGGLSGIFASNGILPPSQSNAVMIAGGGGRGAAYSNGSFSGAGFGGAAGGLIGQDGYLARDSGKGGTQAAGGTGFGGGTAASGSALMGGGIGLAIDVRAGHGGAGYYGGGRGDANSGYGNGGGGGSSYVNLSRMIAGGVRSDWTVGGYNNAPANSSDSERGTAGDGATIGSVTLTNSETGSIGRVGKIIIR